ncbi:protein-L-isoaspartate(D-aspartate) O-methyltransferase [Polynucleobacter kasalickyi]|uniref:Protein-L-isoaspartate O-methyltransferase n=1 Tax=Polynucleobacter kasalickyi TaxID=1938817 RepID=A0A1W2A0A7_9BURK|nr:protein-L-isoaspartate(D-aspartate) O-methyltransferase [Polynucleobacter kasalickyi]SMC54169.1 protein-L-isoaspartate(D-aspartate) O-methyltransferase [Polynucleobacter kasalickyi]
MESGIEIVVKQDWTDLDAARRSMAQRLAMSGITHHEVLQAMATVPRHAFVEPALESQAYEDSSLPIGREQTISKPSVVAKMIQALMQKQKKMGRVLEVGTGCGYQAAVLSLLSEEVYSVERIRSLHDIARANLRPFRISNLRLIFDDGIKGIPQAAPFDGIILAAAGLGIPDPLLEQLAIGGKLIAPVAKSDTQQQLLLIERLSSMRYQRTTMDEVFFVPLQSGTI